MRSILVAVYELQAEEVCVIGHHECGMASLNASSILQKAKQRGLMMAVSNSCSIQASTWTHG